MLVHPTRPEPLEQTSTSASSCGAESNVATSSLRRTVDVGWRVARRPGRRLVPCSPTAMSTRHLFRSTNMADRRASRTRSLARLGSVLPSTRLHPLGRIVATLRWPVRPRALTGITAALSTSCGRSSTSDQRQPASWRTRASTSTPIGAVATGNGGPTLLDLARRCDSCSSVVTRPRRCGRTAVNAIASWSTIRSAGHQGRLRRRLRLRRRSTGFVPAQQSSWSTSVGRRQTRSRPATRLRRAGRETDRDPPWPRGNDAVEMTTTADV